MQKSSLESEQTRVARVYDIRNCGPRHTFLANEVLVSNCNAQNWTVARGKNAHVKIRNCVKAPPGYVMVVADSSMIEVRVNAMLNQDFELLDQFRKKKDVYCEFGTQYYGRPITKADQTERFVSKVAVLSLGYGVGAPRLRHQLALGLAGPAVFLSLDESKSVVDMYRILRAPIVAGWRKFDNLIGHLRNGRGLVEYGPLVFERGCVHMPNGLRLYYPEIELGEDGWSYRNGRNRTKIYGAKMDENFCQSLAGIITHDQWAMCDYRMVGEEHDSGWFIVPRKQADRCVEDVLKAMHTPPPWWPDIPLAAEGGWATNYGDAK